MKKIALITGVSGQDGSYLAELLLSKNYIVHGIIRKSSNFNTNRIDHLFREIQQKKIDFYLHYGDLTDSLAISNIINKIKPHEIYNLGAQSHVKVSFDLPEYTSNVNALGFLRIVEAVKNLKNYKSTKIYQASSSEMFGSNTLKPQSEKTSFEPRSPYAISKLYSYWLAKNYRDAYKMHISNGILFNHESPRRGETFVTKKIVSAITKICLGKQKKIYLGNIYSYRDWGHAKDYVKAMYLIMQKNQPDDYVIATGKKKSVKFFLIRVFSFFGIKIYFKGKGLLEKAYIKSCSNRKYQLPINKCIMEIDKRYFRPTDVKNLLGNPAKAFKSLKWKPEYSLDQLINEMIKEEINNNT